MATLGRLQARRSRLHPAIGHTLLALCGVACAWLAFTRHPVDEATWAGLCFGVALGVISVAYYHWDTDRDLAWHVAWLTGGRGPLSYRPRWGDLAWLLLSVGAFVAVELGLQVGARWAFLAGLLLVTPLGYPRALMVWREAMKVYNREQTGEADPPRSTGKREPS